MKIIKGPRGPKDNSGTVITIGNFDGVHLGHAKILDAVRTRARALKLPSVVYTFDPHPVKVLSPAKSPRLITTLKEKARIIDSFSIDYLLCARFCKEFAKKDPEEFVKDILVGSLKAKEVLVGHDYAFGKGKRGTTAYLKKLGKELGFGVTVLPAYKLGGKIVSSSRVREEIIHGRVGAAAKLLGRDHQITGTVIKGRGVGKGLGFATANLKTPSELLPPSGVYAVHAEIKGKWRAAVANIGTQPTFSGKRPVRLEVHILDFKGKLYGDEIEVAFRRRLRGEKTFKKKEELASQIERDIERARRILK